MRVALIAIFLCALGFQGYGQTYGNEWIHDYNQRYFQIKIANDGLYRLDHSTMTSVLASVGVNINSVDPRELQIFGRGEQQYIHVEGESDGSFDPGDFIEFYAQKNDGWFDTGLYSQADHQPNPYHSLISDTASYYLTWSATDVVLRMTAQNNTNYPPISSASPYFIRERVLMSTSTYQEGEKDFFGKTSPEYIEGEGYYSSRFGIPNGSTDWASSIGLPNIFSGSGAPNAEIRVVFAGVSNANTGGLPNHRALVRYGVSNITLKDTSYVGYKLHKLDFNVSPATLNAQLNGNGALPLRVDNGALTPTPLSDYQAVSHFRIRYPHLYDFNGGDDITMYIPANTGANPTYVFASNFTNGSTQTLYDLTDHHRIMVTQTINQNSSNIQALVPAGGEKKCYLTANSNIVNLSSSAVQRISPSGRFVDYSAVSTDPDYIILTHSNLINEAQQYANYRASLAGNGYTTYVVNIEELYHQFGHGIPTHPLAIRGFADFILQEWNDPKHLFIIGKSISHTDTRNNVANRAQSLVPTLGHPSCDNLLTAGLNGSNLKPALATGRLSARSGTDVLAYLEKVQQYEGNAVLPQSLANKEWMKTILHFGGGTTPNEQASFKSFLSNYEATIEDSSFGGHVETFLKTSSEQIQFSLTDTILNLLEQGTSMMTFFGHAGGSSFDISIENPSEWDNEGRYPLVLANSCFSGNLHRPVGIVQSTSEEYVLIPKRGAIGFIAGVDLGYPNELNIYSNALYNHLSKNSYGEPLGIQIQNAIQDIQAGAGQRLRSTIFEMSLHGDPAVVINAHPKPDFLLTEDRVIFEPSNLTTEIDSFNLHVIITNIGKGVQENMTLTLDRAYPGDIDSNYTVSVFGVPYRDTITFRLPIDQVNGIGINTFDIRLDVPQFSIDEIDNITNNQISITRRISSSELFPIYPYNYAVVPDFDVTLKASTGAPLSSAADYIFEIDTIDTYNSPSKQSALINHIGGVVSWKPDLSYLASTNDPKLDSIVYFWRVAPYHVDPAKRKWREHSFQYVPNKRGWGQSHFYQFKNDDLEFIDYNRTQRTFDFVPNIKSLTATVVGNPLNDNDVEACEFRIDGNVDELGEKGMCGSAPSIYIAVIDSFSLTPWGTHSFENGVILNPQNDFGNGNSLGQCRDWRVENYFRFLLNDPIQMDSMVSMINNKIPDGNYILAYTGRRGLFQDNTIWKPYHFQAFKDLGANSIDLVGDSIPYIFFCRKGDLSSAQERIGSHPNDVINLSTSISNNANFGEITSTVIGPAANWESFHWQIIPSAADVGDTTGVQLFGIKPSGEEVLLADFGPDSLDVLNLSSIVDASLYPYLRLKAFKQDQNNQTAPQLDRWHVVYSPKPEAAINQEKGYRFVSDTLQQGETISLALAVENISEFDMDSLRVVYWVEGANSFSDTINYPLKDSLRAGEVLLDTVSFDTRHLTGNYVMWMEVNPEDDQWQLEQYHFNNLASKEFFIDKDRTNPILDVTFDGQHILDGDIVSAEPLIMIQLTDENSFLLLNDTNDFSVFLIDPDGLQTKIPFIDGSGLEVMRFTPATSAKNRATIEYNPTFEKDGKYTMIFQGNDASDNDAGDQEYRISFEVINHSTITAVMNYPNPFSTSTRFVFTLTGSEVPDFFRIQILTVTGRVVREITRDELGPIHIGRNITDYAWDGRDEYGDKLANGVYLYRVLTKINGEGVEHRGSGADNYFHKGFGKMYLMR